MHWHQLRLRSHSRVPQVFQVTSHIVEFCLVLRVSNYSFFFKTIRISTMHVLRMIVAKAEETHGLRINFVLCFSTLNFLQQTESLLLPRKQSLCTKTKDLQCKMHWHQLLLRSHSPVPQVCRVTSHIVEFCLVLRVIKYPC